MSKEISTGIDAKITTASSLSTSASSWATNVIAVLTALQSTNNTAFRLEDAAFKQTGTSVGKIPVIGSSGNLATTILDTATAGGSSASGKIPLLDSSGKIPASMLSSSSVGGGLKYIWSYQRNKGPGNQNISLDNAGDRYVFTWRPRDGSQLSTNNYVNVTKILVFATGGGGGGPKGPQNYDHRKGGGGAAGSTVIAFYNDIREDDAYWLEVGRGGKGMIHEGSNNELKGVTTKFYKKSGSGTGFGITAGYGNPGETNGRGGRAQGSTVGNANFALEIVGGDGHDGQSDRYGGGSGGASFWGGGYSSGNGATLAGVETSAPGAGAGAANGSQVADSNGNIPFTSNANGKSGNAGMVLILGF